MPAIPLQISADLTQLKLGVKEAVKDVFFKYTKPPKVAVTLPSQDIHLVQYANT